MEIEPFVNEKEKDPKLEEHNDTVKGELELVAYEGTSNLEPCEGMEFESEEAARLFYSVYARSAGFRIRISRYTRSRRDNSIISRLIVCSKEGFRESRGNEGPQMRQRAVTRVGCKAMMMVKKVGPEKWVVSRFVKEHNHGPVPPRKVEVRLVRKEEGEVEKMDCSSEEDEIREPFEGMEFESEEDARSFYIEYARQMGFRARISKYCRSRRDNSIISRQIVCSKEGFREVRIKKLVGEEGRVKRPRVVTRIGCKAMIIVKKVSSGKWVVSRFEKEHNHGLLTSKVPRILQSSQNSEEKQLVTSFEGESAVSNGKLVMGSGCGGGVQVTSRESLTVLYNQLCYEAIKYAQEGSVSEDIYNVAMSALKEAVEKVAAAKRSSVTVTQSGLDAGHGTSANLIVQTNGLHTRCSSEIKKSVSGQELIVMQQPMKFVLIPSTSLASDSKLSNISADSPLVLSIPNGQGMSVTIPVTASKQPSVDAQSVEGLIGNGVMEHDHGAANRKPQKLDCVRGGQAKSSPGGGSNLISTGAPESQMVAIPALPVTLYMPLMGGLSESASVTISSTSGDNTCALVATPIEELPTTACSAAELDMQSQVSLYQPAAVQSHQSYTGPNPLVHATAIAAGARVVPPQEAASLIKAIEARVRTAKSALASGHKQLAAIDAWSPQPCNSSEESQKALDAMRANREGTGGQVAESSEETSLHSEGYKEMEVGMMGHPEIYDNACEDHNLFSDGGC